MSPTLKLGCFSIRIVTFGLIFLMINALFMFFFFFKKPTEFLKKGY